MKKHIKTIALVTTGLVVGVVVARKKRIFRRSIGNSQIEISDRMFSTQIK